MNVLHVGTKPHIELPKRGGFLIFYDEVQAIDRSRVFDISIHSFNPVADLDYRKVCDLVDIFQALFCVTSGTLTESTGLEYIAEQLEKQPATLADFIGEPDKKSTTGHIWAYGKVRRLLRSPVLRQVLTQPTNFSFNPRSVILARINRAELGEFDALALGLFLMVAYNGQLVVPDLGFYGHDTHATLIREQRLIAGVQNLDDLPERLRRRVLSIEDRRPSGASYDDAVVLAKRAGLRPDPLREDNPFNKYISAAMAEAQPRGTVWTPEPKPRQLPMKEKRARKPRAGGIEKPAQRSWKRRELDDTDPY